MKSWPCKFACDKPVTEIGGFVKLSFNTYAHLECYRKSVYDGAVIIGREGVLREQREAAEKIREQVKIEAIKIHQAAPRCQKCGLPMLAERPAALPEVWICVLPSTGTPGVCAPCARAEIAARAQARAPVPESQFQANRPPEPSPSKPTPEKAPEPKDRFQIIELE